MSRDHHIKNPIPKFPDNIDREAFGNYLSGLTDGEGHFGLHMSRVSPYTGNIFPTARFAMTLRADDGEIFSLIRSFWQCGDISRSDPVSKRMINGKPQLHYQVQRVGELAKIIIPHFDRFQLHAKKARDFLIWKEAVLLSHAVSERPVMMRPGFGHGRLAKWTANEKEFYSRLATALKNQRKYQEPLADLPDFDEEKRILSMPNDLESAVAVCDWQSLTLPILLPLYRRLGSWRQVAFELNVSNATLCTHLRMLIGCSWTELAELMKVANKSDGPVA